MEHQRGERHSNPQHAPAIDRAVTWEIDPNQSTDVVTVQDLEQQNVTVRFSRINGVLVYDEIRPSLAEVWVEIAAGSIDTGNQQRDEHLRSGDFLAVEDYPSIYYASRDVQALGARQFLVTGDLRVRDVIAPASLHVSFEGIVESAGGHQVAEFRGDASLSRRGFDLVWDRGSRAVNEFADDQLSITLRVRAIRAA